MKIANNSPSIEKRYPKYSIEKGFKRTIRSFEMTGVSND